MALLDIIPSLVGIPLFFFICTVLFGDYESASRRSNYDEEDDRVPFFDFIRGELGKLNLKGLFVSDEGWPRFARLVIVAILAFMLGLGFTLTVLGTSKPSLGANATVSCSFLEGHQANFFDPCTDHWQVLGVTDAKVTTKCCTQSELLRQVPSMQNGTSVPSNHTAGPIQLPLSLDAIPTWEATQYQSPSLATQRLAVCPHLVGYVIPQGFVAMLASSIFGTLMMMFLSVVRGWVSGCCGEEQLPLYLRVLEPGLLGLLKTLLSIFAGFISAGLAVGYDGSGGWGKYQVFFAMVVNGAVAQNAVDYLAFIFLYAGVFSELIRERSGATRNIRSDISVNYGDLNSAADTFRDVGVWDFYIYFVYAVLLCMSAPLLTHWLGGFFIFMFPVVLLIVAVELIGRVVGWAAERLFSLVSDNWAMYFRCFFMLIRVNFQLTILIRFPFNLALFITGASTYPYFQTPTDVFNPTAWLEAPFYLIQMGSLECYLLRIYTSANHGVNILLTLL